MSSLSRRHSRTERADGGITPHSGDAGDGGQNRVYIGAVLCSFRHAKATNGVDLAKSVPFAAFACRKLHATTPIYTLFCPQSPASPL